MPRGDLRTHPHNQGPPFLVDMSVLLHIIEAFSSSAPGNLQVLAKEGTANILTISEFEPYDTLEFL